MGVRISRDLLEALLAQAAASPGAEVCGLLFGPAAPSALSLSKDVPHRSDPMHVLPQAQHERRQADGGLEIIAAIPCANISLHPSDSFEIDPQALFAANRAERGGGLRLIGHYHSHPNGSARPSARDAAAAEPGRLWLILARGEATLWHAMAGGPIEGAFEPIGLETVGEAVALDDVTRHKGAED